MKITCSVEVRKRSYSANNPRNKQKYIVATLALCQKSKQKELHSDKDAVLILCTQQNPKKRKYKVHNNVDKSFVKLLNYGKATIRFKEPPHDIIISRVDPLQLRRFLNGVDLILRGKGTGKIHFSPTPTKVDRPKKKLEIMKRQDFPLISCFPQSLTWLLQVNTYFPKKINNRIFRLQFIQQLDLTHSGIKELPLALGEINLKQLRLYHNNIENFPKELSTGTLGQNLQILDLTFNQIENISPYFCLMKNLTELYLSYNKIKKLPRNMHCLESLKVFCVSNNELKALPFGMHKLNLDLVEMFDNPLETETVFKPKIFRRLPSLLDCAASAIVSQKIQYSDQDLPADLIDYLIEHCPCFFCGKNSFQDEMSVVCLLPPEYLATFVQSNESHIEIPFEIHFCSSKCWINLVLR